MPLTLASEQRRSPTTAVLIAVIVLAAAIGAAFYFNPHHTADLNVTSTQVFAPVTEIKALAPARGAAMHVVGQAPTLENDLYVVVTVHLQNDLRLPLFLDGAESKYIAPNDAELNAAAPSPDDLQRMEAVFPALKPLLPHPLLLGDTVAPKSSIDGQVLLHFGSLSEAQWKAHKPAPLTIHFRHQQPITATIP